MKVGDTRPVRGPGAVARTTEKAAPATEEKAPRTVGDVTSILGIPEHELTAKVRAAIMKLMEEVDRLRQELAAIPGVSGVALARGLPLRGGIGTEGIVVEGRTLAPGERQPSIDRSRASRRGSGGCSA